MADGRTDEPTECILAIARSNIVRRALEMRFPAINKAVINKFDQWNDYTVHNMVHHLWLQPRYSNFFNDVVHLIHR